LRHRGNSSLIVGTKLGDKIDEKITYVGIVRVSRQQLRRFPYVKKPSIRSRRGANLNVEEVVLQERCFDHTPILIV
jgi:hypothetical protein